MEKKKMDAKKKRTMLKVLCSVLAVVLVLLVVCTAFMESILGMINRTGLFQGMSESEYQEFLQSQTESMPEDYTGEVMNPEDIIWGDVADPLETGNGVVNILLIGQDRREGEERQRSDAMILCTINKYQKTITMTSFMRDMYVQIPGRFGQRINVSYSLGGIELLNKTLEKNFGVQVDGNVEVDFYGCMDAIDLLGGIEIELTKAEAEYLNRRGNWQVTTETGWQLKEGVNLMTGSQAVAYSRIRDIGNSDFGRTERQRKVLTLLFEKAKDLNLVEIYELMQRILPMITTDMTNAEIMGYTLAIFNMLPDVEIKNMRIPADGAFQDVWIDGMAVLLPNLERNRALLREVMAQ